MHRRTWLGALSAGLLHWPDAGAQPPAGASSASPAASALDPPPLRVTVPARQAATWVASHMLMRIYAQAGLTLRIYPMPSGRASVEVLSGLMDGEVVRITAYAEGRPEVICVGAGPGGRSTR